MKVVVAIDSFKGSMTSMQAGNARKRDSCGSACALWWGGKREGQGSPREII